MVIDELIVRNGTTNLPIDSYDNQMIDEIVYEGNTYHFAKQKDLVGETSIIADNAVQEPMVSLEVQGNTEQQTYEGYNLFDISKVNGAANASTTNPNVAGPAVFGTVSDGVLHLKYGMYANGVVWTGAKIPIKQGGNYYVSADIFIDSSIVATHTRMNLKLKNYTKQTATDWQFFYSTDARDTWFNCSFNATPIPDDWVDDDVYLVLQTFGDATQYSDLPVYAKNIMISYGEAKPYEPFVGGIASPNPEYPQEIKSSGNDGLPATIKGVNLFDINNPLLIYRNQNDYNKQYIPKIENGVIYSGGKYKASSGTALCIKTDREGYYTFSYNLEFDETVSTVRQEAIYGFNDFDEMGFATNHSQLSSTFGLTEGKHIKTINCQSYKYIGITWMSNNKHDLQITDLQIEKGDVATPYKPYFNNTIEIPSSVTLADGTVVDLRFAKYKNADYLLMEKGKVKYFAYSTEGDPTKPLSEQMENIPPIEYDLTNTELGQRLLEWAKTEKGTNIVEITSELPVSKTEMSYWRQIIPNE